MKDEMEYVLRVPLFTCLLVYLCTFLAEKPRRGTFSFVETVALGEEGQAVGWDSAQVSGTNSRGGWVFA